MRRFNLGIHFCFGDQPKFWGTELSGVFLQQPFGFRLSRRISFLQSTSALVGSAGAEMLISAPLLILIGLPDEAKLRSSKSTIASAKLSVKINSRIGSRVTRRVMVSLVFSLLFFSILQAIWFIYANCWSAVLKPKWNMHKFRQCSCYFFLLVGCSKKDHKAAAASAHQFST